METINAIEIRGLSKSFKGMYALNDLNMTVPVGSIYGFIGENGSGKSTTEKLICGLLVPDNGSIKLFGKDFTDPGVRVRVGALIETAGCFPGSSVYMNLKMQAINLGIENIDAEIDRVVQILNRRTKNNPVLLGEPGVGKTAIAEGLAVRIFEKKVAPKNFPAKRE